MSVASFNLIFVNFLVFVCLVSLSEHLSIHQPICERLHGILCVRDELNSIVNEAKDIARKTLALEEHVSIVLVFFDFAKTNRYVMFQIKDTIIFDKLNLIVAMEVNNTRSSQPSSKWHARFFARANIDKVSWMKCDEHK